MQIPPCFMLCTFSMHITSYLSYFKTPNFILCYYPPIFRKVNVIQPGVKLLPSSSSTSVRHPTPSSSSQPPPFRTASCWLQQQQRKAANSPTRRGSVSDSRREAKGSALHWEDTGMLAALALRPPLPSSWPLPSFPPPAQFPLLQWPRQVMPFAP